MQRFFAPRAALGLVALAAFAPLAHADEKADFIIKEAELRAKKLNTFSAKIKSSKTATPGQSVTIDLKFRRAPTRLRFQADTPDGKFEIVQNDVGGYILVKDDWVKPPGGIPNLEGMWPTFFGSVSQYVGGTKSTTYVTQGTYGDDGHAVDIVDVVGEKKTVRLTINGEGIVEAVRETQKDGFEDMSLTEIVLDEPIADEAFKLPEGAKILDPKNMPPPGGGDKDKGDTGAAPPNDPMTAKLVPAGKAAPAFTLKTPTGGSLSLAKAISGHKATLINFWATWCGPCMAEMPDLKKLYTRLSPKGFQLLSINNAEDAATVKKFVSKENLKFPVVLSTPKLLSTYGIEAIPTNYLLDSKGKIVFRSVGYDEAGLMKALAKLGLK